MPNSPSLPVYGLSDNTSQVQFGNTYYNMSTPSAYDANIKWEQTATWNGGLDVGFLNNRINASFDLYYKKTKDLLNVVPIPAGSNFTSTLLVNVGNMTNKGAEFIINASPIKSKDWNWNVNFNIAYNTNKITNLTPTTNTTYNTTLPANSIIH